MSEDRWLAARAGATLHLARVVGHGGGLRQFATRCGLAWLLLDEVVADPKLRRCRRCLDTEATREKRP